MRLRAGELTVGVPVEGQWQRPATLRVSCFPESYPDGSIRCIAPGEQQPVMLLPDALLTFRARGQWLMFQVSEVHLDSNPTVKEARVRFVGSAGLLARMQTGDIDTANRVFSRAVGFDCSDRCRCGPKSSLAPECRCRARRGRESLERPARHARCPMPYRTRSLAPRHWH